MELRYVELANRLARMQRHRRKWARRLDITCYRLYEREIADQPLIIDWYDGVVVAWAMARARNETAADEERWLTDVRAAIHSGLGVDDEAIVLKRRRASQDRQRAQGGIEGPGQYERLAAAGMTRIVREQGLRFEVNLSDYLDTGLFLDHRWTRSEVRAASAGKRVLNLFCYTGAFTCYAAAGGARSTVSVDLSNTYLAWCSRNLALNGVVAGEGPGHAHRLWRGDCLAFLSDGARALGPGAEPFDLIVCDPPTFSNSTAMAHDFSVQRDHAMLLRQLHGLLAPGGTLYFSTNFRGFALSDGLDGYALEDLTERSIPEDMRDRRIHRLWRLVRCDSQG